MTKVIGKREVLSLLTKVVKAEGEDRTAVCYYTKGSRTWDEDDYYGRGGVEPLSEDEGLAPECIVGQVVAALGGDMEFLSHDNDTWEAIVTSGDVSRVFKDADVHLTAGANAILSVAQHVQDGRSNFAAQYGIEQSEANEPTWGNALAVVKKHSKGLNAVLRRSAYDSTPIS